MKVKAEQVRADQVLYALERRHRGAHHDLFFTEVKTGRTNYAEPGELLRLDAVAIKPSWASPSITAYEVKVDGAWNLFIARVDLGARWAALILFVVLIVAQTLMYLAR